MLITFLGTGTSHGIPVIGCSCAVCRSQDPRDKRTRASVLIETSGVKLLVDSSPELRLQLIRAGCGHIDAMLLTHAHADHVGGLDDVRIFSEHSGRDFPIYGSRTALAQLRERFAYAFRKTQVGGGKPKLALHPIQNSRVIQGVRVTPIPLWHGRVRVLGYRINDFAYLTDVSAIPKASYAKLRNLQVLVLDALRHKPHVTHFHLAQAILEAKRIGAKKVYFTHMCHLLGHTQTEGELPKNIRLAFDGLQVRLK